ncbi:hypothetical protein M0R45_037600 [Rubus argutus]|uniref:Uncharacterized protein n=1 Tax=Rubus argutus TaxID=59490 RepID=A0AAW1W344_RUBAR
MSFTYFQVVAQALYELNLMSSELGQLAMSSAMLNDVMQWFAMSVRIILTQIVGVTLAGMCCKISFRNSFLLSMIMSMKGIIELNVWRHWRNTQLVDDQFFTQLALSSLVLTTIVTPILRFSYIPQMRLGRSSKYSKVRNIQSSSPNNAEHFAFFVVSTMKKMPAHHHPPRSFKSDGYKSHLHLHCSHS